jgi:hypothetical protein
MRTVEQQLDQLAGDDGFVHWLELSRPTSRVHEAIGLYTQLVATIDLHLRRIYFALRAKGKNERGPERAHLDQVLERLPAAIKACEIDLYRKAELPELLEKLAGFLKQRNDVVHAACRWQPDGGLLVFAHANEKAGRDIKTGEGIAYFIISEADFLANVRDLEAMAGYLTQYTVTWLPKLRPWLNNYWNGEPDPWRRARPSFFHEGG